MWRVAILVATIPTIACGTRTISQGARGDAGEDDTADVADAGPIVIPAVCSDLPDVSKCPGDTHLLGRGGAEQVACARAVARPKCGAASARLESCRNTEPFCYDAAGKITNSPPDPCAKEKAEADSCVEP